MPTGLFDLLSLQGVTFPSTNTSSAIDYGFEQKNDRDAAYLYITKSEFTTKVWTSLQSEAQAQTVTAAMAKKLPGVTAGEEVTFYAELRAQNLAGNRIAGMEIHFFDDTGTKQGATASLLVSETATWERKEQNITVPASATRVNMYFTVSCGPGETIKAWLANVKMVR